MGGRSKDVAWILPVFLLMVLTSAGVGRTVAGLFLKKSGIRDNSDLARRVISDL